jgi:hypothetical protein
MSKNKTLYNKLYNKLYESIDWDKEKSFPLKINSETKIKIDDDRILSILIEKFPPNGGEYVFGSGSKLNKDFSERGDYYNLGFAINGQGTQHTKSDYKVLSQVLRMVVSSTLDFIKAKKPNFIMIVTQGENNKELSKKLSIYASIMSNNEPLLNSLGYTWGRDKTKSKQDYIYILKNNNNN